MEGAADRAAIREVLGTAMWAELETTADRPDTAPGADGAPQQDPVATPASFELTGRARADSEMWIGEIREFVPIRIDVDLDRLRAELIGVAVLWLGVDDAGPIVSAITAARPGVDEFVTAIASIERTAVPGHEPSFIRAMARDMHYRAAQTLCGA
jgi:hypothetical protein